ncbi:MAG: WG repeat-containing protein [Aureibaculum sp.]|nr:WG repeat-containing protein [Aureibaculum sp.]
MKKIFLLILIISTNVFGQKKVGNDVFKMEFLRIADNIQGDQNNYFTDLVERSMYSKKDSLKYGFLNPKGKTVIEAKYTYASDFYNGKSNIIIDSIPGILLKDGNKKMFPDFNATFWYRDDLGLAIKDKKYGFINKNGDIIIPLIHDDAFPFYNGYASVKSNVKWNYINEKGKVIFPDSLIFSYRPIINNKAVFMISDKEVEKKKRMHSEDRKGSQTFAEYLNQIKNTQLKEGLIDIDGNIIIEPVYDEISGYFINGFMRVKNNGKAGIINEKGEIVIPIEYDNVLDYKNNMFTAEKANKWGIIDVENNIIIPFEYRRIRHFEDDLALVTDKGTGYINMKNEIVIEPQNNFNLSGDFYNGLALVKKDKKFGYINKNNEIIIPIVYDNALPFKEKKTIVKKDGLTFFINQKGKIIKRISKSYLWTESDELIRFAE